jgi:hypothetical protein
MQPSQRINYSRLDLPAPQDLGSRNEGAKPEPCTVEGEALKNPQIYRSNFLIEIYFKTAPGHAGGILMEKTKMASGQVRSLERAGL